MEVQRAGKILVIDNNEDDRNRLVSRIKELGHICFATDSAEFALPILEEEPIHLIFIDINIQTNKITNLFEEIKKLKTEIGIVQMIPSNLSENTVKTNNPNADIFLFKPLDFKRLNLVIDSAIEKRRIALLTQKHIMDIENKIANVTKGLSDSNEILDQNLINMVKSFLGLLETRDNYTGNHSKRVATFSHVLCEQYELKERVKRDIEVGSLLHDIGKIGLPDNILLKTRDFFSIVKLSEKERSIYQKHPIMGQEAVNMLSALSQVGLYIRHHHERFDGSGYPDGVKGFCIPLGARIISVIDAYDRFFFGVEKQKKKDIEILFLKHLQINTNKLYDPEVVKKMIVFMREITCKESLNEKRISIENMVPSMILARDVYTKSGVLIISQYEKITENDIKRLNGFLNSNMINNFVYIYMRMPSSKSNHLKKKNVIPDVDSLKNKTDKNFENIYEAIDSTKDFLTLPEIYNSVMEYTSDAKSTMKDIGNILKRDPVIALKILHIANSPLFGFSGNVTTIEDAVSILGYKEIQNILTSISVLESSNYESDIFNRLSFWKHMVGSAVICRNIAKHIGAKSVDEYFIAALFHDIGKLVFDQLYPEKFRKVIQLVNKESIFYRKAERLLFGNPHQEVGEYLLNKWNIPVIIRDAVLNHHSPVDSKIDPVITSAVHLSDIIAHMLHIGESGEKAVPKLDDFAEQKLGISMTDLESFVPEIDEEIKRNKELLFH